MIISFTATISVKNNIYWTITEKTLLYYLSEVLLHLQYVYFVSPHEKWQHTYYWAWASCYESFSRKIMKKCTVMNFVCQKCVCSCVCVCIYQKYNVFKFINCVTYRCHSVVIFEITHTHTHTSEFDRVWVVFLKVFQSGW